MSTNDKDVMVFKSRVDPFEDILAGAFGSMSNSAKFAFILDQLQQCLDLGDYARAQTISGVINPSMFEDGATKIRYHQLMIWYFTIARPRVFNFSSYIFVSCTKLIFVAPTVHAATILISITILKFVIASNHCMRFHLWEKRSHTRGFR